MTTSGGGLVRALEQPDEIVLVGVMPMDPFWSATLTVLAGVAVVGGGVFLAGWVRARRDPARPGIGRLPVRAGLVGLGAALLWLVIPLVV